MYLLASVLFTAETWSNSTIFVSDQFLQNQETPLTSTQGTICLEMTPSQPWYISGTLEVVCNRPIRGQYVIIYHGEMNVTLCEVEIYVKDSK